MPLLPFAHPAMADRNLRAVRFKMKDGSRPVEVLVSNPALENIDVVPIEQDDYFATFKLYRKSFEQIASESTTEVTLSRTALFASARWTYRSPA